MNLIKFIKKIFKKKNSNNIINNNTLSNNNQPTNQNNNIPNITKTISNQQLQNNNILSNNNQPTNQNNNIPNITKTITNQQLQNKYENNIQTITVQELNQTLNTIWDVLKIKENTQAEHLIKAIPSDKWITMDEIKQNIKLEFNIEYKNEKSLYPYLKTLTDINLIKVNNTGKKRSWKKNIIII